MNHAIQMATYGEFGDIHTLMDLAKEMEERGWDGLYLWDSLTPETPLAEWITSLAAIAAVTDRMRLGVMVTVLPRYKPWVFARQMTTIDQIANGRLTIGVGIGDAESYQHFREPGDARAHGAMLDEDLAVLDRLWSGEKYAHDGEFYTFDEVQFLPTPVQRPRIPIWTAGFWPNKKPFRRAAQWDGVFPYRTDMGRLTPDEIREMRSYIAEHRDPDAPFDIAIAMRDHTGGTDTAYPDNHAETLRAYDEAGVTWAAESFWPTASLDDLTAVIRQGPPRAE